MDFIRATSLVHPQVRCWTGTKKADREQDVKLGKDGVLPPSELLDLGSKQIFPSSALSPLTSNRKAVERACLNVGTRFMGGFAIPDADVDTVMAELEVIRGRFDDAKETFLAEYDKNLSEWVEQNEEFKHLFNGQLPDRDTVAKKFRFDYSIYKMQPMDGFEPEADDIANQILHELGLECDAMGKDLLKRKTAIGGKTLRAKLAPIVKRLDTLSFGNGRVVKVCNEFRALHDSIPLERIDHDHERFGQVITFVSMCGDSQRLESIIDGQISVAQLIAPKQSAPVTSIDDSVLADTQPKPAVATIATSGAYF